jgi:hypothetical protein
MSGAWTKEDSASFYQAGIAKSFAALDGGKAAGDARLVAIKASVDEDGKPRLVEDHLQTRLESLIEAFINIAIGYWISFLANAIVLPLVGLNVTWRQNLMIGFFMTFVSVARQYGIRRWAQKYLRQFKLVVVAKIKGLLRK